MAWAQESRPIKQFPPATKRFVNETGAYLQVSLTVRSGEDPAKSLPEPVSFEMNAGQTLVKQYSDGNNPYLKQIEVKAVFPDHVVVLGDLVLTRGGPLDSDYNTFDTMAFLLRDRVILLEVKNQGALPDDVVTTRGGFENREGASSKIYEFSMH